MPPFSHSQDSFSLSLVLFSLGYAVLISTCFTFFVLIPNQTAAFSTETNFSITLPANYPLVAFRTCLNFCLSPSEKPLQVPLKTSSADVPIPTFKTSFFADMDFSMILLICSFSLFFCLFNHFSFWCLSYFLFPLISTPTYLLMSSGFFSSPHFTFLSLFNTVKPLTSFPFILRSCLYRRCVVLISCHWLALFPWFWILVNFSMILPNHDFLMILFNWSFSTDCSKSKFS